MAIRQPAKILDADQPALAEKRRQHQTHFPVEATDIATQVNDHGARRIEQFALQGFAEPVARGAIELTEGDHQHPVRTAIDPTQLPTEKRRGQGDLVDAVVRVGEANQSCRRSVKGSRFERPTIQGIHAPTHLDAAKCRRTSLTNPRHDPVVVQMGHRKAEAGHRLDPGGGSAQVRGRLERRGMRIVQQSQRFVERVIESRLVRLGDGCGPT